MRISFKDLHSVVGGPIVNGVYREILMGLGQDTVESSMEIRFNIVARNDDVYFAVGW
jgi:hypothetical protein